LISPGKIKIDSDLCQGNPKVFHPHVFPTQSEALTGCCPNDLGLFMTASLSENPHFDLLRRVSPSILLRTVSPSNGRWTFYEAVKDYGS
jgi:hypothetical protein